MGSDTQEVVPTELQDATWHLNRVIRESHCSPIVSFILCPNSRLVYSVSASQVSLYDNDQFFDVVSYFSLPDEFGTISTVYATKTKGDRFIFIGSTEGWLLHVSVAFSRLVSKQKLAGSSILSIRCDSAQELTVEAKSGASISVKAESVEPQAISSPSCSVNFSASGAGLGDRFHLAHPKLPPSRLACCVVSSNGNDLIVGSVDGFIFRFARS